MDTPDKLDLEIADTDLMPRLISAPLTGPRRGRPKLRVDRRQTLPVDPGKSQPSAPTGAEVAVARRRNVLRYSNKDLDFASGDLASLLDILPDVCADYSAALNYYVRLANSGFSLEAKLPAEGQPSSVKGSREDPEGTALLRDVLSHCNESVPSQIPGCTGSLDAFIDLLITHQITRGAAAVETVLTPDKRGVAEVVTFDPLTVEFRKDPVLRGKYRIGQKQSGRNNAWYPLNPNLVTYRALSDDLYGRALFAPALRVLPYWMRYWADLQIFLRNAAFGFLDAELDVEILQEMWDKANPAVKKKFQQDFLTWARFVLDRVMADYNEAGLRDPDSIVGHLGVLKIKGQGTSAQTFPAEQARHILKAEIYTALKVPPALMGEQTFQQGDKFEALQIETFVSNILALRQNTVSIMERVGDTVFRVAGYAKPVTCEAKFAPIRVDDQLTSEQARQLRIINEIKLRDENMKSQNEISECLTGSPALGPAPLSEGDADGPSAPREEVLLARLTARGAGPDGASTNGAASGPSFGGGDNKSRNSDPSKDKRQ